jgi:hypothetical protein
MRFRLFACVSEKVDFLGDRTEELAQSILVHSIQPKPLCKVADEQDFRGM